MQELAVSKSETIITCWENGPATTPLLLGYYALEDFLWKMQVIVVSKLSVMISWWQRLVDAFPDVGTVYSYLQNDLLTFANVSADTCWTCCGWCHRIHIPAIPGMPAFLRGDAFGNVEAVVGSAVSRFTSCVHNHLRYVSVAGDGDTIHRYRWRLAHGNELYSSVAHRWTFPIVVICLCLTLGLLYRAYTFGPDFRMAHFHNPQADQSDEEEADVLDSMNQVDDSSYHSNEEEFWDCKQQVSPRFDERAVVPSTIMANSAATASLFAGTRLQHDLMNPRGQALQIKPGATLQKYSEYDARFRRIETALPRTTHRDAAGEWTYPELRVTNQVSSPSMQEFVTHPFVARASIPEKDLTIDFPAVIATTCTGTAATDRSNQFLSRKIDRDQVMTTSCSAVTEHEHSAKRPATESLMAFNNEPGAVSVEIPVEAKPPPTNLSNPFLESSGPLCSTEAAHLQIVSGSPSTVQDQVTEELMGVGTIPEEMALDSSEHFTPAVVTKRSCPFVSPETDEEGHVMKRARIDSASEAAESQSPVPTPFDQVLTLQDPEPKKQQLQQQHQSDDPMPPPPPAAASTESQPSALGLREANMDTFKKSTDESNSLPTGYSW